jgi:OOP family OmpA-OmpF porin
MMLKFNKLSLGVAASVVLMASSAAYALDTFVQCSSGLPVRDSQGECVQSAGGAALPDCLPAVAAPTPAPTVIARSLDARVNFDFDRSELRPEGRAELDRLVSDMSGINATQLDAVGHTDSIGTEAYNQGLSERRANSVATYLTGQGVNPAIISARGVGELQPIAPNKNPDGSDNPEGRAQNRRVDIAVVAEGG